MNGFGKKLGLILTALSLVLLSTASVNGTLAWIFGDADGIDNTFVPPATPVSVNEGVSGDVKSDVNFTNNGNVSCYMRALLVPIWRNADGTGTGLTAEEGVDYTVATGGGWVKSGDYYYYDEIVNPGEKTSNLYESVTVLQPSGGTIKADKTLEIQILVSSVQARGWQDSVYAASVPAAAAFEAAAHGETAGEEAAYPSVNP